MRVVNFTFSSLLFAADLSASPSVKRKKRTNTARYRQPTPTNPHPPGGAAPWQQSAEGAATGQSLVGRALMTSGEEVFL